MRVFALTLLGCAVLVTVGCSSSRSFSRKAVMADHIASVRPDGSSYAPATTHARRAAPTTVTYVSTPSRTNTTTARYTSPTPPPPPAMPAVSTAARPAARTAAPVRRAPSPLCDPCSPPARAARSINKLFGGGCAGGT